MHRNLHRNRNRGSIAACVLVLSAILGMGTWASGCGSDVVSNPSYGEPFEAGFFDPGQGASGSGYGSGGNTGGNSASYDAAIPPPTCATSSRLCPTPFTFPYGGEASVEVRGSFSAAGWTSGVTMTHAAGSADWTATVDIPWNTEVEYKFYVVEADGGLFWETDPNPSVPKETDDAGDANSVLAAATCASFLCQEQVAAGVFDWRDAIIYFVFVDRFFDGDPSTNCNVPGASTEGTPGTTQFATNNYMGGDWQGVTQQINAGYFNTLGVNTLWITVPVQNGDTYLGAGIACNDCSGSGCSCANTPYQYSAYAGYWPTDPGAVDGGSPAVEKCFGSAADLHALVAAAHAKNLKVLFDFAMVDVLDTGAAFTNNASWFTQDCQCGDTAAGCSDYNDYQCWFTPYLAHFDFSGSSAAATAARTYSVNGALQLAQAYGNDAFRLDAIKQVDPSWLQALRPQINAYEMQIADGGAVQHFYMVGETYDFEDTGYIASFINPTTALDGQFDFPLRYRLVDVMLARDTSPQLSFCAIPPGGTNSTSCPWTYGSPAGMQGLAEFMDQNDQFYAAYAPGAVMSTFIGNQDLPRSIHFAENAMPAWLGTAGNGETAIQNAITYNGEYSPGTQTWTPQPATETDPNTYERLANAFAVTLTTKGAPLIYYGDEIGLPGAGDPDNRRAMPWPTPTPSAPNWPSAAWTTCPGQGPTCQQGLHDRIATLTHIRANHPAMRRGTRTEILATDPDLWVFSESTTVGTATDTVYVAINRSDAARTATGVPAGLPELVVGGTTLTGSDAIPARETRISAAMWRLAPTQGRTGGERVTRF